jgi:DNA-binding response OmpR family regulator
MEAREDALGGLRILVVEDEALIAMMLEDLLRQSGAIVLGPARTAAEAVALVQQNSLDCAILDYKLADGSSLRVADALLKLDVPFVFASGCQPSVVDARYPNVPFLQKAFDRTELLAAISALAPSPTLRLPLKGSVMEFRCPSCNYAAFRMVPGAAQAAECLSCGKVSTVPIGPPNGSEARVPSTPRAASVE